MKFNQRTRTTKPCRKGAMLPLIAVTLIIIFVAAAISIDVARIHTTRAELRTATDAASRAGAEALGRLQDIDLARAAAINVAAQNEVAGIPLTLRPDQVVFGNAVSNPDGSFTFVEGGKITSVQVVGSRTNGSADGSVPTTFGKLLGVDSFQPQLVSAATQSQLDCSLVLDLSGSMNRDNRFESLQEAMEVFIQELNDTPQEERLSLAKYSTTATKLVDMTGDLDAIQNSFADQSPDGFTAIGQGMQVGFDSLANDAQNREFALKAMIVMTDGNHNRGVPPDVVARQNQDEEVVVHTITFSNGANQALMADVADIGGGIHIHAESREQLIDAFREIAKQLKVIQMQ